MRAEQRGREKQGRREEKAEKEGGAGAWYVSSSSSRQQLPVTNDNGDSVSCAGRGVRFEMEMGSSAREGSARRRGGRGREVREKQEEEGGNAIAT